MDFISVFFTEILLFDYKRKQNYSADFLLSITKMSIYRALNPLPSNMFIEPGQEGHIKRLENSFKNAKFEQDDLLAMYDNEFR